MAKEKGIDADMDYTSIKASLEKENTSRSGKEDSGNVMYGLSSYTEGDYYQYVYTELEAQLMEVLKKEQDITREELEAAYQESRDAYSYETGVTMLIAETKSENAALLQDAVKAMEEGKSREELTEVFPDISFYELEMNTLDTQEGKSGVYSIRWILASAMREGEISQLFTAGQNSLVMKCLKREDDGVLPFDRIEGTLKSQMQTKKASSVIENEVKKAEVKEKRSRLEAAAKEILLQQQDE
ncbi:peptidyl-prolyl cis-trans isomerase [Blautia producta]